MISYSQIERGERPTCSTTGPASPNHLVVQHRPFQKDHTEEEGEELTFVDTKTPKQPKLLPALWVTPLHVFRVLSFTNKLNFSLFPQTLLLTEVSPS